MIRALIRIAAQAALVALVVGVPSFATMEALPGDAAHRIAASRWGYDMLDAAAAEAVRAELRLDDPVPLRLGRWLGELATLDLGRPLVTDEPVAREVGAQLGASLQLAARALALSLVIAVPVGTAAGPAPGGLVDRASLAASVLLRAVPGFALAVVLILVPAVHLRPPPVAGHGEMRHLVLPTSTSGLGLAAPSSWIMCGVDASGHMRFARLEGLSNARAIRRHGPRNIAGPLAVQAALLIEEVVVVEAIFAWPGIGHAMARALFARDVSVMQGTAPALGLGFVARRAATEAVARLADPPLRAAP